MSLDFVPNSVQALDEDLEDLHCSRRVPMVSAVQRTVINPQMLDSADSEISETADQIRSYHSVVIVDTPQGKISALSLS